MTRLYDPHLSPQRGRPASDPEPMVEMNTTPLIDVMLVLLVMLIITIPVQLNSLSLDLPSTLPRPAPPEIVVVRINASGFLQWNEDTLPDMAAVQSRLATSSAQSQQPEIHLRPSADTPYAFVAAFLVMARKAGLKKVGVVGGE